MSDSGEEACENLQTEPYIVAVDIGTTTLRSHIYNKHGAIKGTSSKKILLVHPKPGWVEMDPHVLYQQMVDCVVESVKAAGIRMKDVTCLGISTQRNTVLLWDRETGEPYHNFMTWQDMRARDYVRSWNNSYALKLLNGGSKVLHAFTRKKRFLSASILKFASAQVTLRLLWLLDNTPDLRPRANDGMVMFGCIDTWLLWKLTGGGVHATDYSNASATGLYDPFLVEWSTVVCGLVNVPMSIFPDVMSTSGVFGYTDEAVFGTAIPITCLAGDQTASMFGECCFEVGDIKCTLGTGMFMSLNTGSQPHASIAGLYPLVGWKIGDEPLVYVAEGNCTDAGSVIDWAQTMGFFEDVGETASIAKSVEDSDGVYFVSAFSGLQIEIEHVLKLGVSPDRIIYAHTCKHESMLQYAADNGVSMTTFDNEDELHKIKRIHPTAKCIIRIRPSTKYKVKIQLGKKFGCNPNEVAHLLKTALSLGLNVIGVSFHVGFLCQDPNAYADAISRCKTVIEAGTRLGIQMRILDIGGGFPGKNIKGNIRFEDIAATINQSLSNHFHDNKSITVIAEPGEYFVASAFTLATKIIARKIELCADHVVGVNSNGINGLRSDDINITTPNPTTDHPSRDHARCMYYLNDGIFGQLRIVTDYEGHGIRPYQLKDDEATEYESCLWGPTCDSLDVVFDSVRLQEHDVGEWLYFPNMGAYTLSMATAFNGMPSPTIHYMCQSSVWYGCL